MKKIEILHHMGVVTGTVVMGHGSVHKGLALVWGAVRAEVLLLL